MSDSDFNPTVTFAVFPNAFTPAELDQIEAYGDRMAADEATVAAGKTDEVVLEKIRVTRTAWLQPTAESAWIYDRLQKAIQILNDRVYQFDLSGFSDPFQYSIYHGSENGHYDWHVDQGNIKTRRKLSISVQLTDPSHYEGCDLQFHAGNRIEVGMRDRGALIAFPSYVLHRVTPCTKGTRKALVAWATGPQFK
jgi:PKHD-type hydroxylase